MNNEESAIQRMEEKTKKRQSKKRERMPIHGQSLKNQVLQAERGVKKIVKIRFKKK